MTKTNTLNWLLSLCFILFGLWIQSRMYLSWDVQWLMLCTERLLHGGDYVISFFETNPPLILYLNLIPLATQHLLHLSTTIAYRLFVSVIAIGSIYLSTRLNRLNPAYKIPAALLAFIYFILPSHDFAQREQLMLMLLLPYLQWLSLKIEQPTTKTHVLIAILAGIGLALKPYFYLPWLLVTLYRCYQARSIKALVAIDNLIIYLILILYFITVYLVNPNYFTLLPLLAKSLHATEFYLIPLLAAALTQGMLVLFVLSLLLIRFSTHRTTSIILMLANFGFVVIYFIEHQLWLYHAFPSLALSTLLLSNYVYSLGKTTITKQHYKISQLVILLITLFAMVKTLIILPSLFNIVQFARKQKPGSLTNQLIHFLHKQPKPRSFMTLSMTITPWPTLEVMTDSQWLNRFPRLWLLPLALKDKNIAHFQAEQVAKTLNNKHPQYIFVKAKLNSFYLKKQIHLIEFLSQNVAFKKAWKHYRFITKIQGVEIYKQ